MPKSKILLFVIVGIAFVGLIILGVVSSSKQTEVTGLPTVPKRPAIPPTEVPSEVPPTALPGVPGEVGPEVPPASPSEEPGEVPGEVPGGEELGESTQSPPLGGETAVPEEAIKLGVSAKGFSPSSFTVKKGETVILAITSKDDSSHVFKLRDGSVSLGVSVGETRVVTFSAPSAAGEYEFFCGSPDHEARGEIGKMIVK